MTGEYLLTPQTERDNRRKSAIITFFIVAAILIIAWWLRFGKFEVDFPPQGIMVQFGMTDFGSGPQEPAESKVVASAATPEKTVEQEVETFESPEAVPVSSKPATTPTETPSTTPAQAKQPALYNPNQFREQSGGREPPFDPGKPLGKDGDVKPPGSMMGPGGSIGARGWRIKPNIDPCHLDADVFEVRIYARRDGTIYDVREIGGTLTDKAVKECIKAQIKLVRLNPDPSSPHEIQVMPKLTIRLGIDLQ